VLCQVLEIAVAENLALREALKNVQKPECNMLDEPEANRDRKEHESAV
jgi:energy-coupling factor transporter ATP-binding protein EcfA2